VPSKSAGGSLQWAHTLGMHHALVMGGELRDVRGTSDELQYAVNGTVTHVENGGRQRIAGAFLEDVIAATERLGLTTTLRLDSWRGHDTSWSPRVSMIYRATSELALTASAYRAFRAPTLNELYRGFRVGNVLTLANAALGPETLSAIETGARWRWLRVTLFRMNTTDTIANVTLSTTPALITRQRQNLGSATSRGAELEGDWRVAPSLRLTAGYLFTDTNAQGRRIPQVPRDQATLQLAWTAKAATLGAQTRWSSSQFDDDLNQFRLRSFLVTDLFASRPIADCVDVTLSAENVFNRRIEAGATPVITLGQPRAVRLGVRYRRR
jgi:outer membrane receptor protein involved in Fe transport